MADSGAGLLKDGLNLDFDRLRNLANHHDQVRQMLGHGVYDETRSKHQRLLDNVSLLTPELLRAINKVLVQEGQVVAYLRTCKDLVSRATSSLKTLEEAAINHLEHHGLYRVRTMGKAGFERTMGLAVLRANLHHFGRVLLQADREAAACSLAA